MALDSSIYNNVGRVNLASGLSDVLNEQRGRDAATAESKNRLAELMMKQTMFDQQQQDRTSAQTAKRNQDLNNWLSGSVQSGRTIEEVMPEAIAKGQEIGVAPEVTQRHVQSVYQNAQTPQARSDFAFTQAYPELVAKQRADAMFAKQGTQTAPSGVGKLLQERDLLPQNDQRRAIYDAAIKKETERPDNQLVAVFGQDGTPVLVPRTKAAGMTPYSKAGTGKGGPMTPEQSAQAQLTTQQTLDQLEKLYSHPGRSAATGASSFMSMVPATDAKGFSSELKTFQAKAFLDAVQKMKGLGALTEQEGAKLVSSIGALDPEMKEEDFAENLKSIAREIRDTAAVKGLQVKLPAFAENVQQQNDVHSEADKILGL